LPGAETATVAIGGAFALVDDRGRAVSERTYLGRHLLVSFGFSHCKVICPRSLARTSEALERLGARADAIQPLYITVDPERDTPGVLRAFLAERFPRFTGLTGDASALQAVRARYRVFAQRADDPEDPDGYAVPHTAFTFLMGPDGRYVHHFDASVGAEEMARSLAFYLGADAG
jgi:protein SCO1/2